MRMLRWGIRRIRTSVEVVRFVLSIDQMTLALYTLGTVNKISVILFCFKLLDPE